MDPRYPVYIVSKGRWESRKTVRALEHIRVPYKIVIEPQEQDAYGAVIDSRNILTLPFSNLGQGSIPARNWIWEQAIRAGSRWHWILDDNISRFLRWNQNQVVPIGDGTIFYCAEDFCERYMNIAQAGFQYEMFARRKYISPPYYLNSRIYSCILIRNDTGYRWRGRYNEDTDLSLRMLKDGWCTVLFNAFLARKEPTMTMKGGNTDELYRRDGVFDGRLEMAKSLRRQHPDVATVTRKWGRWQHQVDYRGFRQRLIRKPGIEITAGINNYGMRLEERIEDQWVAITQMANEESAVGVGERERGRSGGGTGRGRTNG